MKPRYRIKAQSRSMSGVIRFPIEAVDDLSPAFVLEDALAEPLAAVVIIGVTDDGRRMCWSTTSLDETITMMERAKIRWLTAQEVPFERPDVGEAVVIPFPREDEPA